MRDVWRSAVSEEVLRSTFCWNSFANLISRMGAMVELAPLVPNEKSQKKSISIGNGSGHRAR